MYLTQFAFEEAKHTQVFRLWLDAVGATDDLQVFLDDLPTYRKIFYEELPESLDTLATDPSPAAQVRASATYNHVIEGMMALTGYYAWHRICVDNNILPGMQELVRRIGDDERRHMAWGTFTCRRHVAADDSNWAVFEERMNQLIPMALQNTDDAYDLYDVVPFGLEKDEFQQYATDKGMRRFGTISSARGRPLERSTSTTRLATRGHVRRRGRKGAGGLRVDRLRPLDLLELEAGATRAEQANVQTQQHDQERRAGEHRHRPERRERGHRNERQHGRCCAGQRVADAAGRAAYRGREDLGLIDVEPVGEDVGHGGQQEARSR